MNSHLIHEGIVEKFSFRLLAEGSQTPRVGVDPGSRARSRRPHMVPPEKGPNFTEACVRTVEHRNLGPGGYAAVLVKSLDRVVAEAVGIREALPVALVHRAKRFQVKDPVVEIFVHGGGTDATPSTPWKVVAMAFFSGDASPFGDRPRCCPCRPRAVSVNGVSVESASEGVWGGRGRGRGVRERIPEGEGRDVLVKLEAESVVQKIRAEGAFTPGVVVVCVVLAVIIVGVVLAVVREGNTLDVVAEVREGIVSASNTAVTTTVLVGFLIQLDVLNDL